MATTYPLTWDQTGERFFETGVRNCVVYPYNTTTKKYSPGVAWNGISSISESADGGDANPIYADDIKYLDLRSVEDLSLSIEAYMYPDEFAKLDGSAEMADGVWIGQQRRGSFGLSYVTRIGNDTDMEDHGEKLHLVYGCVAAPTEKSYETINDSPEAITFSWDVSTTPVEFTTTTLDGKKPKPTALITIDSTKVDATKYASFKETLYGKDNTAPELPMPDEVYTFFTTSANPTTGG